MLLVGEIMTFHNLKDRRKRVEPNGYVTVFYPNHPRSYKNGYVYYHRVKMENHLGRYLDPQEEVHHKDENPRNNKLSNLELTTRSKHCRIHATRRGYPPKTSKRCLSCRKVFVPQRRTQQFCTFTCRTIFRNKHIPSKKELFKLVWKYPTTRIAKMYGVSDVAVSNWCKKLGIKKPSRGYWRKMETKNI